MNTKQKEFIELLGLSSNFTLKELNQAYYEKAKVIHPDRHYGENIQYWNDRMTQLNDAYDYLKRIKKNEENGKNGQEKWSNTSGDKSTIFTTYCCNKLGLNLETAQQIYKRNSNQNSEISFDRWLRNRLDDLKKYETSKEEVLKLCKQSIMLSTISFECVLNIYECDCEFGGIQNSFSSWLSNLIETCKEIEQKLEKKNQFSIIDAIKNYIYNESENNFIFYLESQSKIRKLCQELKKDFYEVEFEYNYSGFRGSFVEYLEYNIAINRVINDMGMTQRESDEYYKIYLKSGYNGNKLDFLKEAQAVLPVRAILGKNYFTLKKMYDNLPYDEKPESFTFWVELQALTKSSKCSPEKMLEKIYMNTKESGYANTFKDLIISLAGPHLNIPTDSGEFSNEPQEEQETKHTKSA